MKYFWNYYNDLPYPHTIKDSRKKEYVQLTYMDLCYYVIYLLFMFQIAGEKWFGHYRTVWGKLKKMH